MLTLELSSTSLEASFTLIRDVYSAGLNYNDCQLTLTWLQHVSLKRRASDKRSSLFCLLNDEEEKGL